VIEVYRKAGKWRFAYDSDSVDCPLGIYEGGKLIATLTLEGESERVESPSKFLTEEEALQHVKEVFPDEEVKVRRPK